MRKPLTLLILFAMSIVSAEETIELWPNQLPPYAKETEDKEIIDDCWGGVRCAHDVTRPTLTLYRAADATRPWVLIAPGGGYDVVAIYHEGHDIAAEFVARGFSAAVLKYRIPNSETATAPEKVVLADLHRAMQLLRNEQTGVDGGQIGLIGFSASGHLAAYAAVNPDPDPALNPDFTILVYGVTRLDEANREWLESSLYYRPMTDDEVARESILERVSATTPPAFLLHATDDDVCPYTESTLYAAALREHGVENELHLFARGGHGFGPGRDSDGTSQWLDLAANWIARQGSVAEGINQGIGAQP